MDLETTSGDLSAEQKRYLEGLMSGLQVARAGHGVGLAAGPETPGAASGREPVGPTRPG